MLLAGGATACLIAVGALRLMTAYWQARLNQARASQASGQAMVHLVRPRVDVYGRAFWCVVYALGSLVVVWGVWLLDR